MTKDCFVRHPVSRIGILPASDALMVARLLALFSSAFTLGLALARVFVTHFRIIRPEADSAAEALFGSILLAITALFMVVIRRVGCSRLAARVFPIACIVWTVAAGIAWSGCILLTVTYTQSHAVHTVIVCTAYFLAVFASGLLVSLPLRTLASTLGRRPRRGKQTANEP